VPISRQGTDAEIRVSGLGFGFWNTQSGFRETFGIEKAFESQIVSATDA
jgi:hypothetical protein